MKQELTEQGANWIECAERPFSVQQFVLQVATQEWDRCLYRGQCKHLKHEIYIQAYMYSGYTWHLKSFVLSFNARLCFATCVWSCSKPVADVHLICIRILCPLIANYSLMFNLLVSPNDLLMIERWFVVPSHIDEWRQRQHTQFMTHHSVVLYHMLLLCIINTCTKTLYIWRCSRTPSGIMHLASHFGIVFGFVPFIVHCWLLDSYHSYIQGVIFKCAHYQTDVNTRQQF